jgi:16S rRNA (guanine966-N2)-methyltransferase
LKKKSTGKLLSTRVIAGNLKGMKIEDTPGVVRPMTSRVKEALFSIIFDCNDIKMLDLFCGSGSLSIEAFSRGAAISHLVESDRAKSDYIENNLKRARFESAKLFVTDAFTFIKRCEEKYDFIMADPPFNFGKKSELLELIGERELLADGGFLVVHIPKKENIPEKTEKLICYDTRTYGINTLKFYKKIGAL